VRAKPARKTTIRDVAKLAGVSIGTVSRALNRAGRVSRSAIQAVQEAASQLDYAPDATAQTLRTRTTGLVGLLVAEIANPYYARIVDALEARLQHQGYGVILASTHNDPARESAMIDFFRRRRVDGLVLGPCDTESPALLEALHKQDVRTVALDRDFGDDGSGVLVDHHGGALQATRYLLNLGHIRIALLTAGGARRPGRERIAGFRTAFAERGLEPDPRLIRAQPSSIEFSFSEALGLLSQKDRPTAFLCLGTRMLAGVLHAVRNAGLRIPDDVSIISVGDTDLSQLFTPAITSLTWDFEAVGSAVAELVLKQLRGEDPAADPAPARIVITTQLLLRASCAPAERRVTPP
jgi:LacI family transcriptional regulator